MGDFCGKICSCRAAFLSKDANLKLGTAEKIAIADMSRYAVEERIFLKVAHMQLRKWFLPVAEMRLRTLENVDVVTSVLTCSSLCSRAHPILGGI